MWVGTYCDDWFFCFFFSSRRRHTRFDCDWSSDVCSSDLERAIERLEHREAVQPGLLDESERPGQRLEHRREQEVPGKLDEVRAARNVADTRHPAAQSPQHREHRLQGPLEASRDDI